MVGIFRREIIFVDFVGKTKPQNLFAGACHCGRCYIIACGSSKMALYKYLKLIDSLLVLDPNSPLSQRVHPSAITKINEQVKATQSTKKHGEYNKRYFNTNKAVVAKYACENATIRHFAGKKMDLKESLKYPKGRNWLILEKRSLSMNYQANQRADPLYWE